jgi:aryl-alcohol dehydrogenase-like predicted oxidoreductase
MHYRNVGKSGLRVSAVGLGTNNFGGRMDEAEARRVVDRAQDAGITLIDTADIYGNRGGSESIIGAILQGRRDRFVIATKFGGAMDDAGVLRGASRRYVIAAAEASLRRLRTDWIDLYQLHFPDPATPIEETLGALDDLVHAGKVRYIGCSNLSAWSVVDAQWTARVRRVNHFISCQDEYSLVERTPEKELLPAMEAFGLGLLPYFPLAGGLLTGKYERDHPIPSGTRFAKAPQMAERYLNDRNLSIVERLKRWSEQRGHSLVHLAFAWLLRKPVVCSVIAGASAPEQIDQNAAAAEWSLSAEDANELDELAR